MSKMKEHDYEIYNLIRNAFNSQSGYFLSKSESYDVMKVVKDIIEAREK